MKNTERRLPGTSAAAAYRLRGVALPVLMLAMGGLAACAPKPEAVVAECPPPVTSYAKDGTLITLSEPCVLPERFEIVDPVTGGVPVNMGHPAESGSDDESRTPGGNGNPGGGNPGGGDPGDGDPGDGDPGDGDPGDGDPGDGDPGDGDDFETKKEALQRVYGKEDWHNLEPNEYQAVRDYYLEHRKTDNNWVGFKG